MGTFSSAVAFRARPVRSWLSALCFFSIFLFLVPCASAQLGVGQWKVSADTGTDVPPIVAGLKGSMIGFGPEIDTPVCKCPFLMTFRYLFDVDSRVSTKGDTLLVSFTWLHPSKP